MANNSVSFKILRFVDMHFYVEIRIIAPNRNLTVDPLLTTLLVALLNALRVQWGLSLLIGWNFNILLPCVSFGNCAQLLHSSSCFLPNLMDFSYTHEQLSIQPKPQRDTNADLGAIPQKHLNTASLQILTTSSLKSGQCFQDWYED